MKTYKYLITLVLFFTLSTFIGCEDDKMDFSKDYDIPWIVSRITSVSPLEGASGVRVTITGENMGVDMVPADGVMIGTSTCVIVSQSSTSIVVTAPNFISSNPMEVSVSNLHNRTNTFSEKFKPILP